MTTSFYLENYSDVCYEGSSEEHCIYVCSRGFLKICDIHSILPKSGTSVRCIYNREFESCSDITTIYVCNNAIPDFVKYVDTINFKFVLVSGDSDDTIPDDVLSQDKFNEFISNDNLVHWYSQNCISDHPKMTRIPVGLDYHTMFEREYMGGGPGITPSEQEYELNTIIASARPVWERNIKCYSNSHLNNYPNSPFGYTRNDVVNDVPADVVYYEKTITKRIDSWREQVKYAFVISPNGMGMDCHRTWEAILLGCIPIVRKSAIVPLYNDIPVLVVDEWSDITQELLDRSIKTFSELEFSYDKLTMKYWVDKINGH